MQYNFGRRLSKRVLAAAVIIFYLPLLLYHCNAGSAENFQKKSSKPFYRSLVYELYAIPVHSSTETLLSKNLPKNSSSYISKANKHFRQLLCGGKSGIYFPAFPYCPRCFALFYADNIFHSHKYIIRYIHDKDGHKAISV